MLFSRLAGLFRPSCKHPEPCLVQKVLVRNDSEGKQHQVASVWRCPSCDEVLLTCAEESLECTEELRVSSAMVTRRAGATTLCDLNGRPLATFSPNSGTPFVRLLGFAADSRLRQVPQAELVQRALLLPLERPLALAEVEEHLAGGRQVA